MASAHPTLSNGVGPAEAGHVESYTSQESLAQEGACLDSAYQEDHEDASKELLAGTEESLEARRAALEASQARDAASKKKRSSKTAKLKQSKLDIRREQFLAQVAAKGPKAPATPPPVQQKTCTVTKPAPSTAPPSLEDSNGIGSCDSSESGNGTLGTLSTCSTGTEEDVEELGKKLAHKASEPDDESADTGRQAQQRGENGHASATGQLEVEDSGQLAALVQGKEGLQQPSTSSGQSCTPREDSLGRASRAPEGPQSTACAGCSEPVEAEALQKGPGCKGKRAKGKKGEGKEGKAGKNGTVTGGKSGGGGDRDAAVPASLDSQGAGSSPGAEKEERGDWSEDDWEAAAEEFSKQVAKGAAARALAHPGETQGKGQEAATSSSGSSGPRETGKGGVAGAADLKPSEGGLARSGLEVCHNQRPCAPNGLRPEYTYAGAGFSKSRSGNDRAWRPDDVSRPQTLPPALAHRTGATRGLLGLPMELGLGGIGPLAGMGNMGAMGASWRVAAGAVSAPAVPSADPHQLSSAQWPTPNSPGAQPACCPICAEELDVTDSSFVPCSCGFRLCLFCHHRIAADDGRCPGCRRAYSPDVANRLSTGSKTPAPSTWLRL